MDDKINASLASSSLASSSPPRSPSRRQNAIATRFTLASASGLFGAFSSADPPKSSFPVHKKNAVTPNANISTLAYSSMSTLPDMSPSNISGAWYPGVPYIEQCDWSARIACLATPKSIKVARYFVFTRAFAGVGLNSTLPALMSRCTTPCEWQWRTPCKTRRSAERTSRGVNSPFSRIVCASFPAALSNK